MINSYKVLIKDNKKPLLFMFAMLLCATIGALLYAGFVHRLVEAVYKGRSAWFLNRMIGGQAVYPVEHYFRKADGIFIKLNISILAISIAFTAANIAVRNKISRLLTVLFIYSLTSIFIMHLFMQGWGFGRDSSIYAFNKMMTFTAYRPFVYRVLTPIAVNSISSLISHRLMESKRAWLTEASPIAKYAKDRIGDASTGVKYHLTYIYVLICLILLLFSMRYLTGIICGLKPIWADLAPVAALLFLPLTFVEGGFFYDFPELLFMALCLISLIRQKWVFYYIVFFLAILNKESNILLISYFVAFRNAALSKKEFFKHLATQITISIILLLLIRNIFASNPGPNIFNQLKANIQFWLSPESYFLWADPYRLGVSVFPKGGNIVSILGIGFLVFYKWGEKPLNIKRLFIYTSLAVFPFFIYGGMKDEIRNLSLIFPSVYFLSVYSVHSLIAGRHR